MPVEQRAHTLARLDELQIPYELVSHAAVFTVEEMERLQLPHTDRIAKNLFIRDEKSVVTFSLLCKRTKAQT